MGSRSGVGVMRVSSITGRILSYGVATAVASLVFASATIQAQAGHSGHKRTAATHRHVAKHQVHAARHGSRKTRGAHGRHRHGASERHPRDSAANQAEFVKTPGQYLSEQTLNELATTGRELGNVPTVHWSGKDPKVETQRIVSRARPGGRRSAGP